MKTSNPAQMASLPLDELETPPISLGQLTWRRFRRHKMAMFGGVILIFLFIYSFGGALILSEKYANYADTAMRLTAPSAEHPFGTGSAAFESQA